MSSLSRRRSIIPSPRSRGEGARRADEGQRELSRSCSVLIDCRQEFHFVRDHLPIKPPIQCCDDHFQRTLQVSHDIRVPKPQYGPAVPIHRIIAKPITRTSGVLASIYLNNHVLFAAGKIGEERPYRKLADEFVAVQSTAAQ